MGGQSLKLYFDIFEIMLWEYNKLEIYDFLNIILLEKFQP